MTENEQIEEIARTICLNYDRANNKCLCALENGVCDLDCWAGRHPAKALYDAGYRKVERGEWIEAVHDWDFGDYTDYRCSICGTREQNKRPFCPECGADMRGEKDERSIKRG